MKKHALITGGAQGIGKYTAITLLKAGYRVSIADSDTEAGNETIEELKSLGEAVFYPCDVTLEEEVKSCINVSLLHFQRLDVLVNNAAIMIHKPLIALSLKEWNSVLSVNVTGAFLMAKYATPHLKETNGCIINLCSTRAFMSEPDTESYAASKGAIYSLTHALAVSLGPEIRVNCISPGWIDVTEYKKSCLRKPQELSTEDHRQHPAGRVGNAEDISNMIKFLIHPDNSFITGQNFTIDGGMTRKMIYV